MPGLVRCNCWRRNWRHSRLHYACCGPGIDVHVYEQARELREVGAGVQMSPNASRVLHRLGLADALADMGVKPLAWHQRRWQDGRTLLRTPLAETMEGSVRVAPLPDASRRRAENTGLCATHRTRACWPPPYRRCRPWRPRRGGVRDGVTINADVLVGRRRHPLHRATHIVWAGAATLHGLHVLPRPRAGRAARASTNPGRGADLDGTGQAFRPLLCSQQAAPQFRCRYRSGHLDQGVVD